MFRATVFFFLCQVWKQTEVIDGFMLSEPLPPLMWRQSCQNTSRTRQVSPVCCEHGCLGNTATSHTQGHAHRGHAHACLIKHENKPSDWISSSHLICHMTKRAVRRAYVRLIRLRSVMFRAVALSDLWTSKLATWWKRVVTHMIRFTLLLQTPSGRWVCAAVLILKFNSESKMHLNEWYRSMISKNVHICV